jgi:DNA-binding NarL/FixJ family response regulator
MTIPRNMTLVERQVAFAVCCGMPAEVAAAALEIPVSTFEWRKANLFRTYGVEDRIEFALNVNAAVRDAYKQGFLQ